MNISCVSQKIFFKNSYSKSFLITSFQKFKDLELNIFSSKILSCLSINVQKKKTIRNLFQQFGYLNFKRKRDQRKKNIKERKNHWSHFSFSLVLEEQKKKIMQKWGKIDLLLIKFLLYFSQSSQNRIAITDCIQKNHEQQDSDILLMINESMNIRFAYFRHLGREEKTHFITAIKDYDIVIKPTLKCIKSQISATCSIFHLYHTP